MLSLFKVPDKEKNFQSFFIFFFSGLEGSAKRAV